MTRNSSSRKVMTSEDEDEPELVGATGCSRNLRKSPSEVHSSSSHITSSSNVWPYNKCYCLVCISWCRIFLLYFILLYFILFILFYFYFIVLNNYKKWEKWGRRRKKKKRKIFIISSHSSPITLTHSTLSPSIIYIHIFIVALHCNRLSSAIGLSTNNYIITLNSHIINCPFINCSVINSRSQIGPTLSLRSSFLHVSYLSANADSNSYSLHS